MTSSRFCIQCGHELRPGARFCTGCGRVLPEAAEQATPVSQSPPAGYAENPPFTDVPPAEAPAQVAPGYTPTTSWPATGSGPVPAAEPDPRPWYGDTGGADAAGYAAGTAGYGAAGAADYGAADYGAADYGAAGTAGYGAAGAAGAAGPATQDWQPSDQGARWSGAGAPGQIPPGASPAHSHAPPPGPKRSRGPLLAAVIVVIVLGAGAGIAYAVLPSHPKAAANAAKTSHSAAVSQPSSTAAPSPSAASAPAVPARQQAAQALAGLLAQSGTDRAEVTQAVSDVEACSADLSQDQTVFSNAASSRQALLTKLAVLPDRSALPASMLRDLTRAWQVSGEADQDFAQWTQDEMSQGCTPDDQSDASFQAATVPDDQATAYKKAFARLWAPVAGQYGLPVYQYNQI